MSGDKSADTATYLGLIHECDIYPYQNAGKTYQLLLPNDSRPHGLLRPDIVERMPWTNDFVVNHQEATVQLLARESQLSAGEFITIAFSEVVTKAIDSESFEMIHGRHSEPYLIPGAREFCHLERFSHALFGIVARGAHLTAYTRSASGDLRIWVPRRARHLFTFPGKLDSTVAGGVKATDTPLACILAEAQEEASLDADFVRKHTKSVGTLTYVTMYDSPSKRERDLVSPEILYLYDLELPESTVLKPCDDEVQEFYLMSVDEVKAALLRREFKTNSAVVAIDFLVRHGILTQENERDYVEIICGMHRKLPIAVSASAS